MVRYVTTAVAAVLVLVIALRSRGNAGPVAPAVPRGAPPVVRVEQRPEGRVVTVRHAVRGSITRAAVVYELDGEVRTAAVQTDCKRGGTASVLDDGYATVLELTGPLPDGATGLRLVLESETGTDAWPLQP